MTDLITNYWGYFAAFAAAIVLWNLAKLLIARRFGFDIANHAGSFQQSGVKRDRIPGFFGKRGRV